jgi:hypothetical protein
MSARKISAALQKSHSAIVRNGRTSALEAMVEIPDAEHPERCKSRRPRSEIVLTRIYETPQQRDGCR